MIGPKRIEQAVEEAGKVFWTEVQKQFPEITTNEMDVGTVVVLHWQMKEAIERWVQSNLAEMEKINDTRTTQRTG